MNCNECEEKLDRYVDRELSASEVVDLKLHLEGCPPCADQYEFQAHLSRLVRVSCCDQDQVPPAFREKLRQILL